MNDMLLGLSCKNGLKKLFANEWYVVRLPFQKKPWNDFDPITKVSIPHNNIQVLWVSHFPTCKRKIVNGLYIWYQGHDWINKIGTYSGRCPLKFWYKVILVLTIPCSRLGLTFQAHCRMSSICLDRCQLHHYYGQFKTSTSTWC